MLSTKRCGRIVITLLSTIAVAGCGGPGTSTPSGVDATALPELIRGLSAKSSSVRTQSAVSIARMGPGAKDAVAPLIQTLKDRDVPVRAAAAHALGEIGPDAKAAIPALEVLKGQAKLHDVAAKAIERIGK